MSIDTSLEARAEVPISEADVAGFAAKLEAWYETLPPGEQAVLQRLLACAEGAASEECEVEGYAIPGIGARLTRIFAAGLMAATLAAPMAASAAPSLLPPVTPGAVLTDNRPPEQIILAKALALGANFTGSALSLLETVPNGFRVRYQKCDIYYSSATGAHEVHGDIRAKYNTHRGPSGPLGLPATGEQTTSDGIGRYNQFSNNASIYWSPHTGPYVISGITRSVWVAQDAERSRFGYPTSELQSQNGGQWQDFQNDVIYFEGSQRRATENVELSPEQLSKWLLDFIRAGIYVDFVVGTVIDSVSIGSVSDTGYGFSQSSNRRVTYHLEGHEKKPVARDPQYAMDLEFLFFTQKEADGGTSLRMTLVDHTFIIKRPGNDLDERFRWDVLSHFVTASGAPIPRKLIDVTIPAAVPVLSFKVMEDGRIKLIMQPVGGSPLVQLAVQSAFDRLAK